MWSTESIWFEISVVTVLILLGHIFLGHFEERSSPWRKLFKYLVSLIIIILNSTRFGPVNAFCILQVSPTMIIATKGDMAYPS
jgi:hypothetical protein